MGRHTNQDGVTRNYGRKVVEGWVARRPESAGAVQELIIDFDYQNLPDFDEDSTGGSTADSFSSLLAFVPAGAFIQEAFVLAKTAWTGTTPTLTIGLYQKDGTVIDADGIDAAIASDSALAADKVVSCDGALVGGVDGVGSNDAYVRATTGGTTTAGSARLVVRYIQNR